MRRERGTSGPVIAKSTPIKHAERKSGDCARKAAELTSGDLSGVAKATEPAERLADRPAEVSRGHSRLVVGGASEALQSRKVEKRIGRAGNEESKARTKRSSQ